MIELPSVTLVSVSSVDVRRTLAALRESMRGIAFATALFISHEQPAFMDPAISFRATNRLSSIDDYNRFMLYELWRYVDTPHCLVVQADGYVLTPDSWRSEFLDFDYIGAPWPLKPDAYVDPFGHHQRVGNGGFSLRSRRLLEVPQHHHIEWDVNSSDFYRHMDAGLYSEDGNICVHNRHVYEAAGCVFAPIETAALFSIETPLPEHEGVRTFGFHKRRPGRRRVARAPRWRGWHLG